VPAPPSWLFEQVAARIASRLGLALFNFDLIVPLAPPPGRRGLVGGSGSGDEWEEGLVNLVDINYFPGYEKLPGYEALMVRFLSRLRDGRAEAAAVG
jgi:inositol-1,3,4-trisphosphate 5/6-kinase/inositol-tetrakisphosphate 1-kinase